jgi:DNA-binding MarR family transcriptional regulator
MTGEIYRYSVRCDRDRFHALGRAAKTAGVSVEAFVQAHFETILDAQPLPSATAPDGSDDRIIAGQLDISVGQWRVARALADRANAEGVAAVSYKEIAASTGLGEGSIPQFILRLQDRNLIERTGRPRSGRLALWKVAPSILRAAWKVAP